MVLYSMHDGHLLQCALIGSIGRTTLPDCVTIRPDVFAAYPQGSR